MKARRKWAVLGVIGAVALAVGFAVAWVLWGPFSFQSAAAKVKEEAVLLNGHDPQRMLAEANRFYWGHNLPLATPLYQRAEVLFTRAHDPRDALYAKIGMIRTGDQTSFPDVSAFISRQLQTSIVQHDPFLRLRCLLTPCLGKTSPVGQIAVEWTGVAGVPQPVERFPVSL